VKAKHNRAVVVVMANYYMIGKHRDNLRGRICVREPCSAVVAAVDREDMPQECRFVVLNPKLSSRTYEHSTEPRKGCFTWLSFGE
jgi:hypothetical protein